ncbi:MAG TPA: hypothetical protein VMK66_15350, partial [Myxococcales bacterium]|nr:hypothetical protein [Myxococcales bacterium]
MDSPSSPDLQSASEWIAQLQEQARSLGNTVAAAQVHHAMGRIFIERLGDRKSAAVCYQNAFRLNPQYRPNLEAARRLFAGSGMEEKALALHQREEELLRDPAERAESLRAQAVLLRRLGRAGEADELVEDALRLAPDHPALLQWRVEAAERAGEQGLTARLLLRSADATVDPVHRARLLRRAVLLLEKLSAAPEADEETAALLREAAGKLHQADAHDPLAFSAML